MEDNADEAKRARDVLADSGYVVRVAASAQRARLAAVEEAPFDLVFMDFRLPDGDGLRLLPALRRAGVNAPVVLLTGDNSELLSRDAFRAGCADLAVKDLNYHLWLPRMAQALIPTDPEDESVWGSHVLGLCGGRLRGQILHAQPEDAWPPLLATLEAAAQVAIKGVRSTGDSLLGSMPIVHVQLPGRHLLFVLRGGTFAAALLARSPDEEDRAKLLAFAADTAPKGQGADDAPPA